MNVRIVAAALVVVLAVGGTAGCASQPEPVPSTTGFATDAEALAAAEKTYRLYVDALNQVDLSDPETFEEVYRWTTGDASGGARRSFGQMHGDGWTVAGVTEATLVVPHSVRDTDSAGTVFLDVCLDVSDVKVVDGSGRSVIDPDRPEVQKMLVRLDADADSPTNWLISSIDGREGEPAC